MAESTMRRILASRALLPVILIILVVAALLSPGGLERDSTARLTTHSVESRGARGLYQILERLGWSGVRREVEFGDTLSRSVVHAVMAPAMSLNAREVHELLDAVRGGAGLFLVADGGGTIFDSLGLSIRGSTFAAVVEDDGVYGSIPEAPPECQRRVLQQPVGLSQITQAFRITDSTVRDTVVFVTGMSTVGKRLVAAGFEFGSGRVIVMTAPEALRNDVLRLCERNEAVLVVRMFEWLSEGRERTVVFDEYHHGYGEHTSANQVIRGLLVSEPIGRAVLHGSFAGLLLLAAAAVRPLAPRRTIRIERRSPLEHVGALSRAYERVGATGRGTRLLVRGLRRRHDTSKGRSSSDEEYLRTLLTRYPQLKVQLDLVITSLARRTTPSEFVKVGEAIAQIERFITREYN